MLSLLAPRGLRTHLAVVYAFCRAVDDLGDEGRLPPGLNWGGSNELSASQAARPRARLALLDGFERDLESAWRGQAERPLFIALAATVAEFELPIDPFRRLIEANRMDQRTTRYATYDDLVQYCEHSATPVGRIVLGLYGIRDDEAGRLSDATCTALQLANFWQDVKRDLAMGRVYLPQEDMARFGVAETDLAQSSGSGAVRRLLRFEVERARTLFGEGLPLLDRVPGHLRVDLALFSRGGLAILDKIERQGYDTISRRPQLTKIEKGWIFLQAMTRKPWPAFARMNVPFGRAR